MSHIIVHPELTNENGVRIAKLIGEYDVANADVIREMFAK